MARQVFQLKITLAEVSPPVWRRVVLPGGYTLDRVHRAIQLAMGWQDYHLHSFEIDGVQYGQPDPAGELDLRDELDTRLDAVVGKDTVFIYTYDFGDWWEHEILVEEISPADPDERYPVCPAGANGCPPEDVGGAYGYANFLAALDDPAHPEHEAMREWVGPRFDRRAFDADRTTTLLRRLA
jgi:Plasmid pRiA4b ORF-3-like protein